MGLKPFPRCKEIVERRKIQTVHSPGQGGDGLEGPAEMEGIFHYPQSLHSLHEVTVKKTGRGRFSDLWFTLGLRLPTSQGG